MLLKVSIVDTPASFRDTHNIPVVISCPDNARESNENRQCSVDCNYALHADRIVNPDLECKNRFGKGLPISTPCATTLIVTIKTHDIFGISSVFFKERYVLD